MTNENSSVEQRYSEIIKEKYPKKFNITLQLRAPKDATVDDVIHIVKTVLRAGVIVNVTEVIG